MVAVVSHLAAWPGEEYGIDFLKNVGRTETRTLKQQSTSWLFETVASHGLVVGGNESKHFQEAFGSIPGPPVPQQQNHEKLVSGLQVAPSNGNTLIFSFRRESRLLEIPITCLDGQYITWSSSAFWAARLIGQA